jgi:hypothetical protein
MLLRRLAAGAAVAALAGCAPDSMDMRSGDNAFLYKLQDVCPFATVGTSQIQNLVNNATFIDLTSRLYYGRITPAQYRLGVSTNFLGADNAPAIECVLNNLPANRPGSGAGAAGAGGYQSLVDPTPPVVTPTR